MAQGSLLEYSMNEMKNANGEVFANLSEQKCYNFYHFSSAFKKPLTEPDSLENCIEEFLGENILNHPLTATLKLSGDERQLLEANLTLEEFEKSLALTLTQLLGLTD